MIKIYVDGSHISKLIGYGCLIVSDEKKEYICVRKPKTKLENMEAEFMALIFGLEKLIETYPDLRNEHIILANDQKNIRDILLSRDDSENKDNIDIEDTTEDIGDAEDIQELKNTLNQIDKEKELRRKEKEEFFKECKLKFNELKDKLEKNGCKLSFEKVISHSHVFHNELDQAIKKEVKKIVGERISRNNKNLENKTHKSNKNLRTYIVSNSIFTEYQYCYMRFIIKNLKKARRPMSIEEIKELTVNSPYKPGKVYFARTVESLLEEMAKRNYIVKNAKNDYLYAPVELIYKKPEKIY